MSATRDEKSAQEATPTATPPPPSSALEEGAEETMTLESIPLEIYFLFLDKLNPSDWHKLALTYSFLFQVCTQYTEAGWKKKLKREFGIDKPLKRFQDSPHPYHQTYIHWHNRLFLSILQDSHGLPFEKLKKGYVQLHWFLFEEHNMDVVLHLLTDEKELGKISCVELLAQMPDRRDDKTFIHRLVEEGQQTTLDQLYQLAKKRERTHDFFHGIDLAAVFNQLEEVKALLSQGEICRTGLSLLHIAAYFGHEEMLTLVLAHNLELVNAPSYLGTPLNLAVRYNRPAMVEQLLAAGAMVNSVGGVRFEGNNIEAYPLAVAVKIRSTALVSLLTSNHAHVNRPGREDSQLFIRPLLSLYLNFRPINSAEYEIIKLLLAKGADLEYCPEQSDRTYLPLYRAIQFNHVAILKLFIEHLQASNKKFISPNGIPYSDKCLATLLFLFLFLSPATAYAYSEEERALLLQEIDEKTPVSKLHQTLEQLFCNGVDPTGLFDIFNFDKYDSGLKNKLHIAREFHRLVNAASIVPKNRGLLFLFSFDIRFTWSLFQALKNQQGDFANTDTAKCEEIEKTLQHLAKTRSDDLLNALLATHYFSLVDLENTAVSHEEQLVNCLHQLETLDENHDDVDRLKLHCYYMLIYGLESGLPLSWQDILSDDLGKATYDFIREYYFSPQSKIPSLFVQTKVNADLQTPQVDQKASNISCLGLFALPSETIQNSAENKKGKEKEEPISKNTKRK